MESEPPGSGPPDPPQAGLQFPEPEALGFPGPGPSLRDLTGPFVVVVTAIAVYAVGSRFGPDLAAFLFPASGLSLGGALLVVLGGPVVLWLLVLSHEAGHALAARAVGFRVLSVSAGLLEITSSGRPRLCTDWHKMTGATIALPDSEKDLPARLLRMVGGGPAMSLLLGGLALALALSVPNTTDWWAAMRALGLLYGAGSLAMGHFSLFPSPTGDVPSDGTRIARLLRPRTPEALREAALLTLSAQDLAGTDPAAFPEHLLETALDSNRAGRHYVLALLFRYRHRLARGRTSDAAEDLAGALRAGSALDSRARAGLAGEAAWFAQEVGLHDTAAAWRQLYG